MQNGRKANVDFRKNSFGKRKMFSFQQRYVTIKSVWSDVISIKRGNVKKSKSRLIDAIDIKKLKKNSNLLQGTLGSKIYVTLNFFYISLRTQWGDIVSEEAFSLICYKVHIF